MFSLALTPLKTIAAAATLVFPFTSFAAAFAGAFTADHAFAATFKAPLRLLQPVLLGL